MADYDDVDRSERRRSVLILLAVVVVAVPILIALERLGRSGDHTPHVNASAATIEFAQTVGAYHLSTDALAQRIEDSLQSQKDSALTKQDKVAVYARTSTVADGIVVRAASAKDSSDLADRLSTQQPSTVLRDVLTDVGAIGGQTYPTGTLDGLEECATFTQSGASRDVCVWVGTSTLGVGFDVGRTALTQAQLATLTARIRAASEH